MSNTPDHVLECLHTTYDVATCGSCNGQWCFTCHPTPASLCPWENGDTVPPAAVVVEPSTPDEKRRDILRALEVVSDARLTARSELTAAELQMEDMITEALARGLSWQEIGDATGYAKAWIYTWYKRRTNK